jgi:hypothetical protein
MQTLDRLIESHNEKTRALLLLIKTCAIEGRAALTDDNPSDANELFSSLNRNERLALQIILKTAE